jgi:hypothetical protein
LLFTKVYVSQPVEECYLRTTPNSCITFDLDDNLIEKGILIGDHNVSTITTHQNKWSSLKFINHIIQKPWKDCEKLERIFTSVSSPLTSPSKCAIYTTPGYTQSVACLGAVKPDTKSIKRNTPLLISRQTMDTLLINVIWKTLIF